MTILQIVALIILTYGIALGLDWLQSKVPEDCDVFRAIEDELKREMDKPD